MMEKPNNFGATAMKALKTVWNGPFHVGKLVQPVSVGDVVAKSMGTSNPYNVVRATFDALKHQENPRAVAARRNKKVSEIVGRPRDGSSAVETAAEA